MSVNYYENLSGIINKGNFDLNNMSETIRNFEARGDITSTQANTLLALAQDVAEEQDKYGDYQTQIDNLCTLYGSLKTRIYYLEEKMDAVLAELGLEIDISEPANGVAEYVQPTGVHDSYYAGDYCIFNSHQWVCVATEGYAVAYSPSARPDLWEDMGEV